jgi:uncharacterized protein YbjT (DUF2867 family)
MSRPEHTQSGRVAYLAGATGLVGSALLAELLADPTYDRVLAPTRRPLAAPHSAKLQSCALDHSPAGPVDVYFCALGTTQRRAGSREAFRAVDVDLVLDLARRARAAGAQTAVVVSSVGADARALSFYLRCKGEMEQGLQALGFTRLHLLRPSLLIGRREESRPAEALAQWLAPLYGGLMRGPLAPYRPVSAAEVARVMRMLADESAPGAFCHHRRGHHWEARPAA